MSKLTYPTRVDLNQICKDYGIRTRSFAQIEATNDFRFSEGSSGFVYMKKGVPIIFWDDTRSKTEQRYVLAHELGHLFLGHLTHRNQYLKKESQWCEIEANIFAAVLLANDLIGRYGAEEYVAMAEGRK